MVLFYIFMTSYGHVRHAIFVNTLCLLCQFYYEVMGELSRYGNSGLHYKVTVFTHGQAQ